MKKTASIFLPLILIWSCATTQGPSPSLHIGNLPPSVVAELSLEERILAEEAWSDLKQGRESRAEKTLSKLGLESPIDAVGLGYIYSLQTSCKRLRNFSDRLCKIDRSWHLPILAWPRFIKKQDKKTRHSQHSEKFLKQNRITSGQNSSMNPSRIEN